jgi:excisionase family DNA binding protein
MTLSVSEVCQRYGVGENTVLGWIARGELRALNVGRSRAAKKPRWRITEDALAAFELARTSTPPPATRRKKRTAPLEVIDRY